MTRILRPAAGLALALCCLLLPHGAARAATTITVTTTQDVPCGNAAGLSLRCAIATANADCASATDECDTITFAIAEATDTGCTPVSTGYRCSLLPSTGSLPALTGNYVTIDGSTEPGYAAGTPPNGERPQIDLDGTGASGDGLTLAGSSDVLQGMAITGFATPGVHGVVLSGANDTLAADFIGTADGTTRAPNANGVLVSGANGQVHTSLISGNGLPGSPGDGLDSTGAGGLTTFGNVVGANAIAGAPLANTGDGVHLADSGTDTLGPLSGSDQTADLIGGNTGRGLAIVGGLGDVVRGESIGFGTLGAGLGNGGDGIAALPDASSVAPDSLDVGTSGANTISGNGGDGIDLQGATNAVIEGNSVTANGTQGIALVNAGTAAILTNTVSGNTGDGIVAGANAGDPVQALISRNSTSGDGVLGIDLGPDGAVTCAPSTAGPDLGTPCPVITTASPTAAAGYACSGCTVEVFDSSKTSGNGEGKTYLASAVANGSCPTGVTCPAGTSGWTAGPFADAPGTSHALTATATDPSNSGTSEFSAATPFVPTAARVSAFRATRHAGRLLLRWRAAPSPSVIGFRVHAGRRAVGHLVSVHAAHTYRLLVNWQPGPYTLHVLLRGGTDEVVATGVTQVTLHGPLAAAFPLLALAGRVARTDSDGGKAFALSVIHR